MILSDRTIREAIAAGRIRIEPFDDSQVQPASVDVRLDRYFRVFLNHTMPVIDVKRNLEELTELVEIDDDHPFVLHPGEFVLGATLERVSVPDDLVGRVEGKSSLGRLGLLIHSSLPASEPLLVRDDHGVRLRTIGEIVRDEAPCEVVAFDPATFEVGYHAVTGFYEGPADKIYEVRLTSGRRIRVTAGHNLFTVGRDGELRKVRTGELHEGVLVAVPRSIPEPPVAAATPGVVALAREAERAGSLVEGPSVRSAFVSHGRELGERLTSAGLPAGYDRSTGRGPVSVAADVSGLLTGRGASTGAPTSNLPPWHVYAPEGDHKRFATVPLPDWLLVELRAEAGLSQGGAAHAAGYSHGSDLADVERRRGRDDLRVETVRRLAAAYAATGADTSKLDRLVDGGLAWDRVVEVVDTGRVEPIYDLEVRPGGRKIENFLAGSGGVFVSNTAGFIDAGFDGHITLELSNVANLPITLYPGMKIGQISFLQMTTPAEVPYGADSLKSKYQGQRGPTPSRYWENFSTD